MKYHSLIVWSFYALLVSCSIQETEVTTPKNTEKPEFYASIEGASTRVFVDEDLNVLWNAEDQVSIFNKNTYNQPYKFLGNTGDNAGGFNKVDVAEFVTGKPINNIVSVYPYQEDTQISESGVLTVNLPKEQTYSEKTFGTGTNTMVSVSTDNYLQFKNVGGYLKLRMYGEGVSISTIILKGNNNEKLSGKAYVTMPLDGTPSVEMASDAETEVILNSKNSVLLGSSTENCTDFWFVLPPVTFSKGFTIIVKRKDGQAFTKTASSPVTITRNNLLNMAPFEVKMEGTQPNNVIYYTSIDSTVVTPMIPDFGAKLISNNYIGGVGVLTFDGAVTYIGAMCFMDCNTLRTISLPNSVTRIERLAFDNCKGLSGDMIIPEGVVSIGYNAFNNCSGLNGTLSIPESVTSIGKGAFKKCSSLSGIKVLPIIPPQGAESMFTDTGLCPIYIPAGSEEAYLNADYWRQYALRMRVEGNASPIVYSSTDYSQDGEVMELQKATVGQGVNIILMGDGFLDKDMVPGGKYEQKMRKAMEQFFAYEPYTTFRNRFNVYAVKVVSENDLFGDEGYVRRLTYEENGILYFRTAHCYNYATAISKSNKQPSKIAVLFNTTKAIGRSFCALNYNGSACCFILDPVQNVINHELGGHAFGLLMDEYVEGKDEFTEYNTLDNEYKNYGFGANIDWRSNTDEVRWSRLLKDPRYKYEGLGIYEGGYLYAKGLFRSTENSVMRIHYIDTGEAFNAPSREQIYKMIMKYSEGDDWEYDYEEFVKADERGRMEAAEVLGPWKASASSTRSLSREDNHQPPVFVDDSVKEVGMDKNGNIVLIMR